MELLHLSWMMLFILISLFYNVSTLPVTSKPLASNPDHLTWEALLTVDSRSDDSAVPGRTRKITPKSIFLPPGFNAHNAPTQIALTKGCPSGYRIDQIGECIQFVNVDPIKMLTAQLETIPKGDNNEEESYDYDAYDSPGPYQVNIPLNIRLDGNQNGGDGQDLLDNQHEKPVTRDTRDSSTTTTILPQHLLPSFVSVPSPTTMSLPTTTDFLINNNTTTTSGDLEAEQMPLNSTMMTMLVATTPEIPTTSETPPFDPVNLESSGDGAIGSDMNITSIFAELQKDMLVPDGEFLSLDMENGTDLAITDPTITTTVVQHRDDEQFAQTVTEQMLTATATTSRITSPNTVPTTMIFTTDSSSSSSSTMITTTPVPAAIVPDLLSPANDSESMKRMRDAMAKHELKETTLENIDSNNRFVYHHLGTPTRSSNDERLLMAPSSRVRFPMQSLAPSPVALSQTVRFPGPSSVDHYHDDVSTVNRGELDTVQIVHSKRAPSPLSQQPSQPPSPSPLPSLFAASQEPSKKPSQWWTPFNGWQYDLAGGQTSLLLRFWSRFPGAGNLQQPPQAPAAPAAAAAVAPVTRQQFYQPRGNSRSPTEDLYREVSAQDIYKVMSSRNWKHTNR